MSSGPPGDGEFNAGEIAEAIRRSLEELTLGESSPPAAAAASPRGEANAAGSQPDPGPALEPCPPEGRSCADVCVHLHHYVHVDQGASGWSGSGVQELGNTGFPPPKAASGVQALGSTGVPPAKAARWLQPRGTDDRDDGGGRHCSPC